MANENTVAEALARHVSVRDFTPDPVTPEELRAVMAAARGASSSCFLQVTTVIRVTDEEEKRQLAVLSGNQMHIAAAPEFWVFCADYHRNAALVPDSDLGWTEQLMVACTDAAIMAQAALSAAESLGLGGVYAGGIRNHIEEVDALLGLPKDTFPVLGLAFGHPAYRNEVKPRLPDGILFQENRYTEAPKAALEAYDREMNAYYLARRRNPRDERWADGLKRILLRERRQFILPFLRKKGFALK